MTVQTLTFEQALQTLNLPGLHDNLFSSPDWVRVLLRTYRLNIYVKYIIRDNRVDSYIIYSVVKNFLEWKICICSFCDYCDGHVRSPEDWRLFFEALRKEYPNYRIAIRHLRDPYVQGIPELKKLSLEKFHLLDVRAELDVIWKRTHDSYKSAVKQAGKKGVTVRVCEKSELKKFYGLHLNIRKNKYHIFPQPYKFFDAIWEVFITRDRGALLGAYDPQGKFIGGNVYLICGNTLYYKFNTSALDALQYRPNNLLFWEGIKYAKEKKMEFIDLGSSGCHQKGLILFKDHIGAVSQHITHLGFTPPGYKFSEKRILGVLTKAMTLPWMPDFMVRAGSHLIYPFLA